MATPHVIVQDLSQFFQPLVERSLIEELGWPDFVVTDYLTTLLVDFSHVDRLYAMKHSLDSFEGFLGSSQHNVSQFPESSLFEEKFYRHIGDVILLTVGLFPDTLCQTTHDEWFANQEIIAQYMAIGREAYNRVCRMKTIHAPEEAELFEKLAENFLLCAYCLDDICEKVQAQHRRVVQDTENQFFR
jgi:hypothetical protein